MFLVIGEDGCDSVSLGKGGGRAVCEAELHIAPFLVEAP